MPRSSADLGHSKLSEQPIHNSLQGWVDDPSKSIKKWNDRTHLNHLGRNKNHLTADPKEIDMINEKNSF